MYSSLLFYIVPLLKGQRYFKYLAIIISTQLLSVKVCGQQVNFDDTKALAILDSLEAKATVYSESHPTEKVYVHFDKPFYVLGEYCWYKAYVVGSDLYPTDISSILNVDWINPSGQVIKHQRLKIENGGAIGSFTIDSTLTGGTYTVRAYTHWMRNEDPGMFYSKNIKVIDPRARQSKLNNDKVHSAMDLQFFPEGGNLVAGIQTQLAFKAIDTNGSGIDIKGQIVDEKNNFVATFRSGIHGMGVFPFTPPPHKSYRAILDNGQVYQLPIVSERGLVMTASNRSTDKILVRIQASEEYISSGTFLVGHSRGSVCYAAYVRMESTSKDISIPKDELPEGVLQLTLFDRNGIPQCERMLFIRKDQRMAVAITSDKKQYSPRDSIVVNFKVTDTDGNPAETSLSVSVTDGDFVNVDENSENIYTRLLLQSDLKGNVENPGWYFESSSNEKSYALDLVMLTHGWSRYNWNEILAPIATPISFMPEIGITLEGQIMDKNEPVANAPFTLAAPRSENDFFKIYESDSLGHFSIPGLDFSDSTTFAWRVMSGRKGKVRDVQILLNTSQDIPPVIQYGSQHQAELASTDELIKKVIARFIQTGVWNLDNTKILDEFVVSAVSVNIKAIGPGAVVIKPSADDLKVFTSQFISRYALGISLAKLIRTSEGEEWRTPAGAPIVIRIDGYLRETTGQAGNPYFIFNSIPVHQIDFVVVTGDAHHGFYIDIETKEAPFPTVRQLIKVSGYDVTREFYHPRYGPLDNPASAPDNRMTLYWNANLRTDRDGMATAKFYNTDATKKLVIAAEGIANGNTISIVQTLGK